MSITEHSFLSSMYYAIELAKKAQWQTLPNPCVGAVLVKNGSIVAEGWHKGAGTAHAEVACIDNAKANNIAMEDCTLVVTLEPCKHYGKTPPCVDAITAAGIKHVIVGALDPTEEAGGGVAILRERGVIVETGIAEQECQDLIADFTTWQCTPYPYLILKLASTMDGRIATRTGHSKWITATETRHHVHFLRSKVQAVIVGGNTFHQDDPKLTCRLQSFMESEIEQPLAVVTTSRLPDAGAAFYLLRERPNSTIFWTTVAAAASPKAEALRKLGVHVMGLPSRPKANSRGSGMRAELELNDGLKSLREKHNCQYVLCEGGGRLGLSFLDNHLAQELHLHLAPKILGDNEATPLFDGRAPILMDEALQLRITESAPCASDIIITMRPKHAEKVIAEQPTHVRR